MTVGASAFAIALAVASLTMPIYAQMSPGPLARPHQEIDTPLQCFACHGKAKGAMNDRCVECHKDIGWLVQQDRGFHAAKKGEACATCHPDHAGRDFEMVAWRERSADKFDHKTTGWPLEGKHAAILCAACHGPNGNGGASASRLVASDPTSGKFTQKSATN